MDDLGENSDFNDLDLLVFGYRILSSNAECLHSLVCLPVCITIL